MLGPIMRMAEVDPNLVAEERRIAGRARRSKEVKQRYSTAA
jgi:hypothetical protein